MHCGVLYYSVEVGARVTHGRGGYSAVMAASLHFSATMTDLSYEVNSTLVNDEIPDRPCDSYLIER